MLIKDCAGCKFCAWMVGIGQGVRCRHVENQAETVHAFRGGRLPLISEIVDCKLYKSARGEEQ